MVLIPPSHYVYRTLTSYATLVKNEVEAKASSLSLACLVQGSGDNLEAAIINGKSDIDSPKHVGFAYR